MALSPRGISMLAASEENNTTPQLPFQTRQCSMLVITCTTSIPIYVHVPKSRLQVDALRCQCPVNAAGSHIWLTLPTRSSCLSRPHGQAPSRRYAMSTLPINAKHASSKFAKIQVLSGSLRVSTLLLIYVEVHQ